MLGKGLSEEEIEKRLIRLRNLEPLHLEQKQRNERLVTENKSLKDRVFYLESIVTKLEKTTEDFKLQIEELRTIVFGKKKKSKVIDDDDLPSPKEPENKVLRTNDSYKRPLPKDEDVTGTIYHSLNACVCGTEAVQKKMVVFYEEDIPIPAKRSIQKYVVEKGYCCICKRWNTAIPLPSARVILGNKVKRYVVYLSIICRQSYSQIEEVLKHSFNFAISQGEIANIIHQEGERLRPEYERLRASIREEPSVHLDESTWNILINRSGRGYAWTMVGGTSKNAIFTLGKNRGGGNAKDLLGDSKAVRVTDDYPAYWNLEGNHQLCTAHILRKLRDLARSAEMTEEVHAHCIQEYGIFATLYADIEKARTSDNPSSYYNALHVRLIQFATVHQDDPAKLARVKTQVRERSEKYLTCLLHPHVASDNNAAERSLRHLVLKRKISFGSLSEKTAETLAILCSVLLSLKQNGTLRNYLVGV